MSSRKGGNNVKNKKGPAARKREGPPREIETKRFLHSKKSELESPQAKIFLEFMEIYPPADATLAACEMLWFFLVWLKSKGIHLVDEKTVFCFPFDRLVKFKDLK